ncbi:MAG TPA: cell division protein FtsA [Prevotella sp.]|nr:cell division protein FtsA [Prevotella sp.]
MPAKDFIVAIELGSSKIRGIAGGKNADGSIAVYAIASEDSLGNIRKGIVYNIEKTVQSITNIVRKLKTALNRDISQVYVGVGGQSILSVKHEITKDLSSDTIITQQMVNELMDANRNKAYADKEILDVAIQEYKVGNDLQTDPAGIQADRLTGNFLNILWRKAFYDRLNDCFERANIKIAELDIAPLALADCILDDTSKRAGCLLVDLGYDTTTMLVYHKNILRHIAVIPLGGKNITKDLTTLNIDDEVAEKMKRKYGSAYNEPEELNKTMEFSVDLEHKVSSVKFQQVVEARMQEIIENVWAQVSPEYQEKLNGGIILTGGGANLKNVETAFRKKTKIEKITTVQFIPDNVNTTNKNISVPHDGTMNTLLGLLKKGDMSCDGGELNIQQNIFAAATGNNETKPATEATPQTEQATTFPNMPTGTGRVPTPGEKFIQERQNDKKEWDKAQLDNTIEAYERYISAFPNGDYVKEANAKIDEMKRKESFGSKWGAFKRKLKDLITEGEDE